ncbi:hypothetical protein [Nocardia sp. NPDC056000]|uniref:hypothetical protein n=1 Tax=Nocardia sp. NPDC056000 TaxID=3345674 RepID=UPI0035D8EF5D
MKEVGALEFLERPGKARSKTRSGGSSTLQSRRGERLGGPSGFANIAGLAGLRL